MHKAWVGQLHRRTGKALGYSQDSPAGVKVALAPRAKIIPMTADLAHQTLCDSNLLDLRHIVAESRMLSTVACQLISVHSQLTGCCVNPSEWTRIEAG
jgi:hypothetical protein